MSNDGTNPNEPAYPADDRIHDMNSCGLTKREYFAALAMQALVASNDAGAGDRISDIPGYAVDIANALIEALNEGK